MNPAIQTNGVKPWLLCCVNGGFGQLSFWPSTALLFLATTQTISAKQKHSSSTTRFNLWQLPHLHLQFPIEIWSFDLNAYKRTNTFQPRNISHIDIVDDVCTRKYTKNNSITKTMTRKLCCYLDFIYSLNKSSYKCAGCKENSPQEVHWSLTTLCFAVVRIALHRTQLWSQRLS